MVFYFPQRAETKAAPIAATNRGVRSFIDYLTYSNQHDLSAYMAVEFYRKVMPFFSAVDMRSTHISRVPCRLYNSKDENIPSHPLLDLLKAPNADMDGIEFMEQVSSFYDITGEAFIVATGRVDAPPLELICIPPHSVLPASVSPMFGLLNLPEHYQVQTSNGGMLLFYPKQDARFGIRYLNREGTAQLWHMRAFNPLRNATQHRGMPAAQPLWFDMEQYIAGNVNNISLLHRGSRPSLAWVNKTNVALTDVQWERMKEEKQKYEGALNTGASVLMDGVEPQPLNMTNVEMQFKELQQECYTRISTAYRIPMPLFVQSAMSYNNLQTSMEQFYDNAILPGSSKFRSEFSRFLIPRYKDLQGARLGYNEKEISALAMRRLEQAKKREELKSYSPNEIRVSLGDTEILGGGGEFVYRPVGEVPINDGGADVEDSELESKYRLALFEKGMTKAEVDLETKSLRGHCTHGDFE